MGGHRSAGGGGAVVRASWPKVLLRVKRAPIPVGHSVRAGIAVGAPFIVGALTDQVMNGMWVGLAALLLAAGEREGTYRLNFLIIVVSTPIAAAGFLIGFANQAPLFVLVPAMAVVAFVAGLVSGLGSALSVAAMQFLLVASIALGVEITDWWPPLMLYLAGGVLYAALLGVQLLVDPRRPQRLALAALLAALADLAVARADGAPDREGAARVSATVALRTAIGRTPEIGTRMRPRLRRWTLDARVTDAAERVEAALVGESDAAVLSAVGERLTRLAAEVAGSPRPASEPHATIASSSVLDRVAALSEAMHAVDDAPRARERPVLLPIGREALLAATRLAVCFGIAVAAKAYFPFGHWFWVPLTVCLVMKPDFGSVFSRAVLRVVGTAVGIVVGTVLLLLVPKGLAIGVVIGLLAASVPWLMMRSYALQAVAITPIVILLIDQIQPGVAIVDSGWLRLAATAVGGAIVVVFGYLVWPRSRRSWIRRTFASAVAAISEHLRLAGSAVPDDEAAAGAPSDRLVAARRAAYDALSQLRGRMERQLSEPPPADTVATGWLSVCAAAEPLADEVTAYAVSRVSRDVRGEDAQALDAARAIASLGDAAPELATAAPGLALTDPGLVRVVDRAHEVQARLDALNGLRGDGGPPVPRSTQPADRV